MSVNEPVHLQATEAFLSGKTIMECPYLAGDPKRTEWLAAFALAHFEMQCA